MKAPKKSNHHLCDYKTDYHHDYHHKAKLRQKSRSEKCFIQNSV